MSNLTYDNWIMNDVVPDDLFFFKDFTVQQFLRQKKSFLADYKVEDTPYSEWLLTLCCNSNLNPKLLLTQLQKEQSLVSKTTIPPDKILTRCLGYGMTDSGDLPQYYGFDKQHQAAVKGMASNFTKFRALREQPKILVDNGTLNLQPANAFTSMLYKYTPWTGSPDSTFSVKWGIHGVYLFWKIWKNWWKADLKSLTHLEGS